MDLYFSIINKHVLPLKPNEWFKIKPKKLTKSNIEPYINEYGHRLATNINDHAGYMMVYTNDGLVPDIEKGVVDRDLMLIILDRYKENITSNNEFRITSMSDLEFLMNAVDEVSTKHQRCFRNRYNPKNRKYLYHEMRQNVVKMNKKHRDQLQFELDEYPDLKFRKLGRRNTNYDRNTNFYYYPSRAVSGNSWKDQSKKTHQWSKTTTKDKKPQKVASQPMYSDIIDVDNIDLDEGSLIFAPYDVDFGVYQLTYNNGIPYAYRNETRVPLNQMPPMSLVTDPNVSFNDWEYFAFGGSDSLYPELDPYCWLSCKYHKPYYPNQV